MRFSSLFAIATYATFASTPSLAAQATAGRISQQATTSSAPNESYQLGVNDEVEVTIFGTPNQVTRTRIKEDGTITLPFIGPVKAAGRTAREFSDDVRDKLHSGGYFTKPVVSVDVTQFVSNSVTVSGNVGAPGVLPLDHPQTVGMMVARAGGIRAGGADFVLLRRPNDPVEHHILLADLTGEWSAETPLSAGDTLYVPIAPQIFIYGQVNAPGASGLLSGMTLRQVIARAGGPTLAGSLKNVTIFRGTVKLKKVKLDEIVQPGDTIYVNERLF